MRGSIRKRRSSWNGVAGGGGAARGEAKQCGDAGRAKRSHFAHVARAPRSQAPAGGRNPAIFTSHCASAHLEFAFGCGSRIGSHSGAAVQARGCILIPGIFGRGTWTRSPFAFQKTGLVIPKRRTCRPHREKFFLCARTLKSSSGLTCDSIFGNGDIWECVHRSAVDFIRNHRFDTLLEVKK